MVCVTNMKLPQSSVTLYLRAIKIGQVPLKTSSSHVTTGAAPLSVSSVTTNGFGAETFAIQSEENGDGLDAVGVTASPTIIN